jgi:RecG-like helicase
MLKKEDQRNTNGHGRNAQMNRLLQGDVGSGKTISFYEHAFSTW